MPCGTRRVVSYATLSRQTTPRGEANRQSRAVRGACRRGLSRPAARVPGERQSRSSSPRDIASLMQATSDSDCRLSWFPHFATLGVSVLRLSNAARYATRRRASRACGRACDCVIIWKPRSWPVRAPALISQPRSKPATSEKANQPTIATTRIMSQCGIDTICATCRHRASPRQVRLPERESLFHDTRSSRPQAGRVLDGLLQALEAALASE